MSRNKQMVQEYMDAVRTTRRVGSVLDLAFCDVRRLTSYVVELAG